MKNLLKSAFVGLLCFSANIAQKAAAGVSVLVPTALVQLNCVDGAGERSLVTQNYNNTATVAVLDGRGINYTATGTLNSIGQGTLYVPSSGSTFYFYYSGSQLYVQFNVPGYVPGYAACQIVR